MSEFRKGDVVDYRFEDFSGRGVVTRQLVTDFWDVLVEKDFQDVRCFKGNMEHTNPPLNVFDLIGEKLK